MIFHKELRISKYNKPSNHMVESNVRLKFSSRILVSSERELDTFKKVGLKCRGGVVSSNLA